MPLSDREVKNVLSFYVGARKAVFIAGAAVLVVAVLAVIVGIYSIGRKDGKAEAVAPGAPRGQTKPALKPKPRAESQEEIEALELQEAEEAAESTKTAVSLGENDAKPPESGAATAPETKPVQLPDAASPAPAAAMTGKQTFVDGFAAPPSAAPPVFRVTVRPRKHGWPRRFFGAIGRGLGKALRVR